MVALASATSLFAQNAPAASRSHNNNAPHNVEHHDHHNKRHVCVDPVATPEQIKDVVDFVKKQSFDDDKMAAACLCVKLCPIPTDGLMQLAKLFSFDSKRCDFLVFAYNYCPDKEYYYRVRDSFTFRNEGDAFMKKLNL